MSDSQCLNTPLLEVMILSKNERVCIRDLSNLTLQILVDASWFSMNVCLKRPNVLNTSKLAPSWPFDLRCGIEDTGSPCIIWTGCDQVLRHPFEHGTSSIGKHLLTTAHIAKFNEVTKSEVTELTCSTVNDTALTILRRQGSRGIAIVS